MGRHPRGFEMRIDRCAAAQIIAKVLAVSGAGRLPSDRLGAPFRLARGPLRNLALRPLASRLAASPTAEHREIAAMLRAAIEAENYKAALGLVSTAGMGAWPTRPSIKSFDPGYSGTIRDPSRYPTLA